MTPSMRSLRTASCAAAIDGGRPIVSGSMMPGNSTVWRTGRMMSASGGSGGCVSLLLAGSCLVVSDMFLPFVVKIACSD